MALKFSKMHGAGNDFVVIDRRADTVPLDPGLVQAIADRHTGVGFDQLLSIERTPRADCHAAYRIHNADGSSARQCGNGVRCLAAWLYRAEPGLPAVLRLDGPAGVVACTRLDDGRIRVDMGVPSFAPDALPFLAEAEAPAYTLEVDAAVLSIGIAAIGNPHAVIEVASVAEAPVARIGAQVESHPRFPDRANVGFAEVVADHAIRLRVFERGVGETLACGSGACAAAAVLIRRGRVRSPLAVTLPGGTLQIDWPGEGQPLSMSGPAAFVFEGTWNP